MPRILLIEDDALHRLTYKAGLERGGHEVHLAESGIQALRLLREEGLRPDAVITDVVMPDMDGLEVVSHFRRHHRGIPVLVVSGKVEDPTLRLAVRLGASAALRKPVAPEALLAALEGALAPTA